MILIQGLRFLVMMTRDGSFICERLRRVRGTRVIDNPLRGRLFGRLLRAWSSRYSVSSHLKRVLLIYITIFQYGFGIQDSAMALVLIPFSFSSLFTRPDIPPLPQCQHERDTPNHESTDHHIPDEGGSSISLSRGRTISSVLPLTTLALLSLRVLALQHLSQQTCKPHFILPKVKDTQHVLEEPSPENIQSNAVDPDRLGRNKVRYADALLGLIHEVASIVEEGLVRKCDPKRRGHRVALHDIHGQLVVPHGRRVEQSVDRCEDLVREEAKVVAVIEEDLGACVVRREV